MAERQAEPNTMTSSCRKRFSFYTTESVCISYLYLWYRHKEGNLRCKTLQEDKSKWKKKKRKKEKGWPSACGLPKAWLGSILAGKKDVLNSSFFFVQALEQMANLDLFQWGAVSACGSTVWLHLACLHTAVLAHWRDGEYFRHHAHPSFLDQLSTSLQMGRCGPPCNEVLERQMSSGKGGDSQP